MPNRRDFSGGPMGADMLVQIKDVGALSNILIGFDGRGHTSSVTLVSSKYPSGKTLSSSFFSSIYHLRSPGTLSLVTNLYDVMKR